MKELLSNVDSGGGIPAGNVGASIGGSPAEAKEEKNEEVNEDTDDDMVRVMFLFPLRFPSCAMCLPLHCLADHVCSIRGLFVGLIFAVLFWSPILVLFSPFSHCIYVICLYAHVHRKQQCSYWQGF